jgi:hypothetical protein
MCRTIDDLPTCNDAGCAWYSCAATEHCRVFGADICGVCPGYPGCIVNSDGVVIFDPEQLTVRFHDGSDNLVDPLHWRSKTAYVRYCQLTGNCLRETEPDNARFRGTMVPVSLVDAMGQHDTEWMNALDAGLVHARPLDAIFFCPTGGCKSQNMSGAPQEAWQAELWVETSERRCNVNIGNINHPWDCMASTPGDRIDEVLNPANEGIVFGYARDMLSAFTAKSAIGFSRGCAVAIAYTTLARDHGFDIRGYVYGAPAIWRAKLRDPLTTVDLSTIHYDGLSFNDIYTTFGTVATFDRGAFVTSVAWKGDPVTFALTEEDILAAFILIYAKTGTIYHDYDRFVWGQYVGPTPALAP